jgi:hypothetical protein
MQCLPSVLTENEYYAIIISILAQDISELSIPETQRTITVRRSNGLIVPAVLIPFTITAWAAVDHESKTCRDGILVFRKIRLGLGGNNGYKNITTLDLVELNKEFVVKKINDNPLSDEYKKIYCERLVSDFGINMYPLLVAYENSKLSQ